MLTTAIKASFIQRDIAHWDIMATNYAAQEAPDYFRKVGHIKDITNGNGGNFRVSLSGQDDATISNFRVAQFYAMGVIECNNFVA